MRRFRLSQKINSINVASAAGEAAVASNVCFSIFLLFNLFKQVIFEESVLDVDLLRWLEIKKCPCSFFYLSEKAILLHEFNYYLILICMAYAVKMGLAKH